MDSKLKKCGGCGNELEIKLVKVIDRLQGISQRKLYQGSCDNPVCPFQGSTISIVTQD